jgi:raffinose/stachyose/melibiose transport system permease protein
MSRASGKVAHYVLVRLVLLLAVLWIVPVWLAIVAGTKTEAEYATTGLFEFGTSVEWINFGMFFVEPFNFGLNILNSLTISLGAVLVSLVIAFPVSYAISIGRHRLRGLVLAVCILIFLLPLESVAFPIYLLSKMVGMYGNQGFMILTLGIIGSAFATFLLSNVMRHVPADVVDAAQLDGAGRWVTLTRVVWPLMLPTVLTVALLLYVFNWNEYLLSLLLLPDTSSYTVPIAISAVDYGQRGGAPGQLVAAGAVLGSLPSLIIFLFFQRTLVRGITAGASSG